MRTYNAHPNTSAVLAAWKRLIDPTGSPDFTPMAEDYPDIVDHIFILQRAGESDYLIRTAGAAMQARLGRNLSDQNFLGLWSGPDRRLVDATLETLIADHGPALIEARGETLQGRTSAIEIALAPLAIGGASPKLRLLGLYQPLDAAPAADSPIAAHRVLSIHAPAPQRLRPKLRLVASNP